MPRDWIGRQVERLPEPWRDVAHRWWPIFAIAVGVVLGTLAFIIGGNLLSDVSDQQDRDREQQAQIAAQAAVNKRTSEAALAATAASNRIACVLSRAVTSIPLVKRPEESDRIFRRRIAFAKLIVRLAKGIDCDTALAAVLHPKGGGAQSPQTGSQLPGASRPLLMDRTVDITHRRIRLPARTVAVVEGRQESQAAVDHPAVEERAPWIRLSMASRTPFTSCARQRSASSASADGPA